MTREEALLILVQAIDDWPNENEELAEEALKRLSEPC